MTKYREILRLSSLGLSQQSIADSCGASKKTVNRILKRAKEINLYWPLDENETDAVIAEKLFSSAPAKITSGKKMPDFDYIQKELLRNGVNTDPETCHLKAPRSSQPSGAVRKAAALERQSKTVLRR